MGRKPLLLFLVVLLVVGFFVGYLLRGWLHPRAKPAPQHQTVTVPQTATGDIAGWCCEAGAIACTESPSSVTCIKNGGRVFHKDEDTCNRVCQFLRQRH